jgi:hypothetical protein
LGGYRSGVLSNEKPPRGSGKEMIKNFRDHMVDKAVENRKKIDSYRPQKYNLYYLKLSRENLRARIAYRLFKTSYVPVLRSTL